MEDNKLQWDDTHAPVALKAALEKGDRGAAGELLDVLFADLKKTGRTINPRTARRVLMSLRNYAWFDMLGSAADIFSKNAQDDPGVLIPLAQARIELGEITGAVEVLLDLKNRMEAELSEDNLRPEKRREYERHWSEATGLLGRSYKQYYINAKPSKRVPRKEDLKSALDYYQSAFDRGIDDYLWHGVNCLALMNHEVRVATGRQNALSEAGKGLAKRILDAIEEKEIAGKLESWDLANRIEANLGLGETQKATDAVIPYLNEADVFNIQSTYRQLTEVWMLNVDTPPGDEILPMMKAQIAKLGGGAEDIDLDPTLKQSYEKVWNKTSYKPLLWLKTALNRAQCVARIGRDKYTGDGTGFLFDGSWISDLWAGRPLLLTNAHVCTNNPEVQNQIPYPSPPENLTATFLAETSVENAIAIKFKSLVWTSKPSELDATLLELESMPPGCSPLRLAAGKPPLIKERDDRVNILGHPEGKDLHVSLQDNKLVDIGERYIHYITPTTGGSSGSPVFNQQWELVALHHAASPEKEANRGIRIDLIIEAIQKDLIS